MAAIDKLYVHEYYDLYELRLWAMIYCPKILVYFYQYALEINGEEFEMRIHQSATNIKNCYKQNWDKIAPDDTKETAVQYMINNWHMSEEDARKEAEEAWNKHNLSLGKIKKEVTLPIANFPIKVDKKLKWICPVDCVRKYLAENCGIKTKWYHKLFWRGRKHFEY